MLLACRILRSSALAVLAVLLLVGAWPLSSEAEEYAHHPVNLTFFYPFGTNQDPEISTNFRISLLYGRVGAVRGLDFNGIASVIDREMKGLQFTGIYSQVGGPFRGLMFTGGVSNLSDKGKGIQISGLVNYNRERFKGLQYSTLFNFTEKGYSGIQASLFFNLNNLDGKFLQYSTIANANAGSFFGLQLAAGTNFVNEELLGAQVSLANTAGLVRGLQAGLLNLVREMHGLQLGVVNFARYQEGLPIGVFNWSETVDMDWVTYTSSQAAFNTGVRTTIRDWYSVFAVGGYEYEDELPTNPVYLSWYYGRALRVPWNSFFGVDLGWVNIIPTQEFDDPAVNDGLTYSLQARLTAEKRFNTTWSIFVGGGVSTTFDEYSKHAGSSTEGIWVAGISLF